VAPQQRDHAERLAERVAVARQLRASGKSVSVIANHLGVHPTTAANYLRAAVCPRCSGPRVTPHAAVCLRCMLDDMRG
jgi:hypothetical protein